MVANGEADTYPYYKNVIQMSRIWRAYLNSEVADGFGPILRWPLSPVYRLSTMV